ncbi:hypothetical protein BTR22_14580 [Alkalihalophilus pseudofirmus]|nr:hypothetical protein BTR22_14580 [Alkalihalophilus pseudofirmus]
MEVILLIANWPKHIVAVILTGIALIVSVVLFLHFSNIGEEEIEEMNWNFAEELEEDKPELEAAADPGVVTVDMKGAVMRPGVYQLHEGSRVFEAIESAGGLLPDAFGDGINLAQLLVDEMVIYVPYLGEEEIPLTMGAETQSSNAAGAKISLNKASQAEFETLPGIGPAKAEAILSYREEQGAFQSVEELMNVSGIGPKSFEKLQELVTVQ